MSPVISPGWQTMLLEAWMLLAGGGTILKARLPCMDTQMMLKDSICKASQRSSMGHYRAPESSRCCARPSAARIFLNSYSHSLLGLGLSDSAGDKCLLKNVHVYM